MSNFELSLPQNQINENPASFHQSQEQFVVRFWGVRGLIPTPSTDTRRYGGNTACVEMLLGEKRLVFDGGTGLRILGKSWEQLQQPIEAYLFFTNCQTHRIQGFPFFAPAFIPGNSFHMYGTAASNGASLKQCLGDHMLQPHFPYPLQVMQSELQFYNLVPTCEVMLGEITILSALINQAQRSLGYRISWRGYSVTYLTDLQISSDKWERENIIQLGKDTDLLIANATYIPPTVGNSEFSDLHWQAAVNLADSMNVKRLVISHHRPDDGDDFLDQVQTEVKFAFPKAFIAYEGMTLSVITKSINII